MKRPFSQARKALIALLLLTLIALLIAAFTEQAPPSLYKYGNSERIYGGLPTHNNISDFLFL